MCMSEGVEVSVTIELVGGPLDGQRREIMERALELRFPIQYAHEVIFAADAEPMDKMFGELRYVLRRDSWHDGPELYDYRGTIRNG